jgi:hypothetical protein
MANLSMSTSISQELRPELLTNCHYVSPLSQDVGVRGLLGRSNEELHHGPPVEVGHRRIGVLQVPTYFDILIASCSPGMIMVAHIW